MKVGIQQKVLNEAISKGSIAALSEDAQADTSTLALIIKSVKITADNKHLTVETGTNMLAVKYTIPVSEESGIIVKETGCILVPAKELLDWISLQGDDSNISITLQKFATPEIINTLEDSDVDGGDYDASKFTIKKIGTVKLVSKTAAKANQKWEIDCYEPSDFASVNFNQKAEKCFDIQGAQLPEAITNVAFAAQKKDHEHVLDSISIQTYNKAIYFSTTDMARCALYMVPKDAISNMESTKPLLIPAVLLDQAAKIINKEANVTFSYSEEIERVFISQDNLKIRLASTEKEHINKFPNIKVLVDKEYGKLAEIPKNVINGRLVNAALVNGSSALFVFNKTDGTLTLKAISEDNKYKPSIGQTPVTSVSKDAKIIYGVSHLLEGLKAIKADEIHMQLASNLKSIKVTGKDDVNFSYFCMAVDNPKLKEEAKEE